MECERDWRERHTDSERERERKRKRDVEEITMKR